MNGGYRCASAIYLVGLGNLVYGSDNGSEIEGSLDFNQNLYNQFQFDNFLISYLWPNFNSKAKFFPL